MTAQVLAALADPTRRALFERLRRRPQAVGELARRLGVTQPAVSQHLRFTEEITTWWPIRTHSVGEARTERVVFEGRVGGEIHEIIRGGVRAVWGTVTAWEPPHRVAFTWHPGQAPDLAQEVEVRFVRLNEGTRLELTHRGWERLGAMARRARFGYNLGWAYVLAVWAGRTGHPLVLLLDAVAAVLRFKRRFSSRAAPTAGAAQAVKPVPPQT